MTLKAHIVSPIKTVVGESPVWDERTGCLYWVDIIGRSLMTWHADFDRVEVFPTMDFPTALGLCLDPTCLVVSFAEGVCIWNQDDNTITPFVTLDDEPFGNRLNEGAVAPDGTFWVGSMQNNLAPDGSMRELDRASGAFYRVTPEKKVTRLSSHQFSITNTLVWDTERQRVIYGDGPARTFYSSFWSHEGTNMELENQPWLTWNDNGYLDGSCIDSEGYIWNARYGGGCLLRFAPDGTLDQRVELPATNVTACCFGGPDLKTLFVTTATNELSDDQVQSQFEGALLSLGVEVPGNAPYYFGI